MRLLISIILIYFVFRAILRLFAFFGKIFLASTTQKDVGQNSTQSKTFNKKEREKIIDAEFEEIEER